MAMPSQSEEAIFNIARHITAPDARRQYLEQACQGDAALAQRVLALLAVHENGGSFMARPAAEEAVTAQAPSQAVLDPDDAVGRMVGDYKLLQQIGEGGMGTVYMAEQLQPVQRKVAVKIIKPGMDNKQIFARFEAERQALALMDHPNIAKVLDAGTIPLQIADSRLQIEKTVQEQAAGVNLQSAICNLQSPGRPYFVMELVKGVPITQYCEDHHLPPRERLELFIPVCQAVQHAHQKVPRPQAVECAYRPLRRSARAEDHRFRRGQGDGPQADRADAVHGVRRHHRHAGVHVAGAGGAESA
jgi:hypothetical protein